RAYRVGHASWQGSRAIRCTYPLDTVPVWVLTLSFLAFVRLYLRAGRRWLVWSICGLRTLVLILNFISTSNINFRAITGIRHFSLWGEIVSVPVGVPNPWGLL